MKHVHDDLTSMKDKQVEVFDSLKCYGEKLDEFTVQMESVKKIMKSFEAMKVRNECGSLRAEIELLQQQGRMNNVEISGIPEKRGENILQVLNTLFSAISAPLTTNDIDSTHRVAQHSDNINKNIPKNIVVKFTSEFTKNKIMEAARKHKGNKIITRLFNNGDEKPIFFNEHLSPFYKKLYKKVREFSRSNNYKYTWAKDGKIFIKKI
ncbi:hypothetical protein JTB14_007387 [Gonioctena quinquepunctata]|nr:hypothetical protein JTB14_007387 [Gonioctena quinquepunctata]